MVEKMMAAVLEDLNKMVVKEVEIPHVDDYSLLVKVKACAICSGDVRTYHYGSSRVKPPQILGHEIGGEVIKVGSKVKKFKQRDRVSIGADMPCGECEFCKNGMSTVCPHNYGVGFQFQGGFAEYIPINSMTLKYGPIHKIPEDLSYEEAALAEPLGCCLHALELSQFKAGDTVAIIGAGPMGCLFTELSKNLGASKVILAQRSSSRLALAERFNPDVLISTSEEDLVKRVLEETDNLGVDIVMVACSSVEAQEKALSIVKSRGRVNLFGGLPKEHGFMNIDSNVIHYKECFVHGSHGSSPRDHKTAISLLSKRLINGKEYLTRKFSLKDIIEALKIVEKHDSLKIIIVP